MDIIIRCKNIELIKEILRIRHTTNGAIFIDLNLKFIKLGYTENIKNKNKKSVRNYKLVNALL